MAAEREICEMCDVWDAMRDAGYIYGNVMPNLVVDLMPVGGEAVLVGPEDKKIKKRPSVAVFGHVDLDRDL